MARTEAGRGRWLLKQEPSTYSFADLERDRETVWDGVHNPTALLHIRAMQVGDLGLFYHSGSERACIGILTVVRGPERDPSDTRTSWTVRVRPIRRLGTAVPLATIRGDPVFAGFDLLRISRLSVVPVSRTHWDRILAYGEGVLPTKSGPKGAARGRGKTSATPKRVRAAPRRR